MNPKIFVGVAVAALAVIIGGVLAVDPETLFQDRSDRQDGAAPQILPLEIRLGGIDITKVTERSADIEVAFEVFNPNQRSVLIQVMDYQLYETGYSESMQITGGQIGNRPGGMVEFGNNYYTLLGQNSITLKDKVTLRNSGSTPELWSALSDGTASWRVTGDMFYNLSSVTSGQENELHFEFTQ